MSAPVRPLADFVACLAGPTIWALHFFVVYGAETVVCLTVSPSSNAMQWTVIAATGAALAAIAVAVMRHPHDTRAADGATRGFLRMLALSLAALSTAAILATAFMGLRLPACLSPAG
jgi:hypothetical protein